MPNLTLFRVGRRVVAGDVVGVSYGHTVCEARYAVGSSGDLIPMSPYRVTVGNHLVINRTFDQSSRTISESKEAGTILSILKEGVSFIHSNFRRYGLPKGSIVAYDDGSGSIVIREGKGHRPLSLDGSLEDFGVGQALALEGSRPVLSGLGLIDDGESVFESLVTLDRQVHVWMKKAPFRDVTLIKEGAPVSITGYLEGCATLDVDGEEFWIPIEEQAVMPARLQKDWKYFDLNQMKNFLPSLPSKTALAPPGTPGPDNNYNVQPDLNAVAGFLFSVDYVSNEDYGMLKDDPKDLKDLENEVVGGADLDQLFGK